MLVRFIDHVSWTSGRAYRYGDIVNVADSDGKTWIKQGYCVRVEDATEAAIHSGGPERAVRRRGRPRKRPIS